MSDWISIIGGFVLALIVAVGESGRRSVKGPNGPGPVRPPPPALWRVRRECVITRAELVDVPSARLEPYLAKRLREAGFAFHPGACLIREETPEGDFRFFEEERGPVVVCSVRPPKWKTMTGEVPLR